MKNTRTYKIGLALSAVAAVASFFLPESLGDDKRAMIFGLGVIAFVVFLVALIVAKIKAKKHAPKVPVSQPAVPPVAPVSPSPMPEPAPTQSVEQAPAAAPAKKASKTERIHVRGVDHYTKNVVAVATENEDYSLTKRELIEDHLDERVYQYDFFVKGALVPEPDNEDDPNAIMVQADGLCIGHVPKGSTAHVRKLMESGRIKSMDLSIGGGKYKEVTEIDDGEYELDKGELKYSAVLELHLTDE